MALECCHFTVDVWWRWNVVTSLWMCGGAGMLSRHCGCVLTLECCHFTVNVWWRWNVVTTVDVRWRWNVVTSLWMCGGAGMLSLHCGCVVALQHVSPVPLSLNTFTVRIWIAIRKCLHEFEYNPEVCGATNGSFKLNLHGIWDFFLYNGVNLFFCVSTIFLPINFLISHIILNHLSSVKKLHCNSTKKHQLNKTALISKQASFSSRGRMGYS
jgi:hypothetical protein